MSVYVDKLRDYGWYLGPSCHMTADTLEELMGMAHVLGMKPGWLQLRQKGVSHPHCDLTQSRRERAVRAGARECDQREYSVRAAKANWLFGKHAAEACGDCGLMRCLHEETTECAVWQRAREMWARAGFP